LPAAACRRGTESAYPWEPDALDFVRDRLPDQDPYHAWTNFEFIADGGSVNEVDLLVLAPGGFYLVEIKSRPGTIDGDAHTWTGVTAAATTSSTIRCSWPTARRSA
jgi:hypothetical protein